MSSSKWGKKLATKLGALNESSSKESIQTLAKWIVFNRKHTTTGFVPVLQTNLLQAKTPALQLTYLSVVHEVLILDKDNAAKWERMEDMRVAIGEGFLLKIVGQLHESSREKIRTTFLKEWDDSNSFGGPTLINEFRKSLSTSKVTVEPTKSPPANKPADFAESPPLPNETPAPETIANKSPQTKEPTQEDSPEESITQAKEKPDETKPEPLVKKAVRVVSSGTTTFDFEACGIPAAKIDPQTLLEPTRAIASLQIARDLRNDGAVQLSSLLTNLPENIKQSCQEKEELTADKARDYAMRTPDVLIDMDLEDQLQSIRMYRDIVKRQRAARKQLIHALLQSRCKFGADDAAEGFENADRARGQLLKRKQVLMDAMELEGLDVTEEDKNLYAQDTAEFAPLEWHKKTRTEES